MLPVFDKNGIIRDMISNSSFDKAQNKKNPKKDIIDFRQLSPRLTVLNPNHYFLKNEF
jgi:hypothetical protein